MSGPSANLAHRLLIGVALTVALASCATAPAEPAPAPALTVGPPEKIWPDDVGGERVTASTIEAGYLLLGTSEGHVYAVLRGQSDVPPRLVLERPARVNDIEFSPDGSALAVTADGVLFGRVDGGPFKRREPEFGITTLAFNPGGTRLAVKGSSGVVVYDVRTGDVVNRRETAEIDETHGSQDIAFTADGGLVAVGENTDRWPADSPTATSPRIDCGCPVSGAAAAPDGAHLVFGTTDSHLVVVETQSGRVVLDETISAASRDLARAVAVSRDGRRAVALTTNGNGMIVDIGSQRVLWRGTFPGHAPLSVRFVEDDRAFLFHDQDDKSGTGPFATASWIVPLSGP